MTRFAIALIFATFASGASAQTIETNIDGLVIKNYACRTDGYMRPNKEVRGNLVNRTSEAFSGKIRIKVIDPENDILWQSARMISVGAQNGVNFELVLDVGTCASPNKVQVTLER